MPLKRYGVLKGRAVSSRMGSGGRPHYQVHVVDRTTDYRIAINVKSNLAPSELLYLVDDDFRHPVAETIRELPVGWSDLPRGADGGALDFIRGNLFDKDAMRALPHSVPGPDNDLNEKIDAVVRRALSEEEATVYAFGERWGPEAHKKDGYFGFLPGNGVHDIHMNQGNHERFRGDDGVWQDGALLIHFPSVPGDEGARGDAAPEQWFAVFLAFQSQAWHTDDDTGHALTGPQPSPRPSLPAGDGDGQVRIVAALVNPPGDDPGRETVTLLNAGPTEVDLSGWALIDGSERRTGLSGPKLAAGESLRLRLDGAGAILSNKGGAITLVDPAGLKIDGVAYTREAVRARPEGWSVVF